MKPSVLPTKCPVCGSAMKSYEPWTEDEPEVGTYDCGAVIEGFADSVAWDQDCRKLTEDAKTAEAWDAAYEETEELMRVWCHQTTADLESKYAARTALKEHEGDGR